ncbi:WYL domain-containing protein [Campylobacter canadensis]|uniref:WYL domain-containing protein n=1 Tax=Campylobacter canadensis TaxID=449520 RepID=A0ABS7WSC8_9BACT|nr:WYL domain-containing protein [Campylobacter canadensis]MBZ7987653.1 WYL domain-containing protein [Campylobacter canadensis]MBZ7995024.1 WYL domain-containing protein [Campylobacter canadensis]MBZ7996966.1 WYL domain-containing protein [Campylobacter canadensis]MBZ7998810.1 WYL domain-containing protein [Campylobacter canadensis]MBZ8000445.1 WYL domain-containing protein [Campylobacter canadensis]
MANSIDILIIYFKILKGIYEHKDGITSEYFIKNFQLSKQTFSKYIQHILSSEFGEYIYVDKSKKNYIYKPALPDISEVIKYYNGDKYTYDEFLASQSVIRYLNENNAEEILNLFKENFVAIDNPLQDNLINKMEFAFIKQLLQSKRFNYKINLICVDTTINDAIFLKIIYSDKNYYALLKHNNNIFLRRLAFIKEIQKSKKYLVKDFPSGVDMKIKAMSNSLSLYDCPRKIARLQISENISKYFQADMKKFFKSQKIINNSPLQIEIEYTNSLEILRFVKTWLPDIKILSPQELIKEYKNNLKEALKDYK